MLIKQRREKVTVYLCRLCMSDFNDLQNYFLPQHFLNFFPLPHGHGAFGLTFFFASVFAGPIIPLNAPGSANTSNS